MMSGSRRRSLPCAGERRLCEASIWSALRPARRRTARDRHLVAVEVGVEGFAAGGVELDRLTFDENRLERLNPQTVERRSAVEEHHAVLDDLLERVPDLIAGVAVALKSLRALLIFETTPRSSRTLNKTA